MAGGELGVRVAMGSSTLVARVLGQAVGCRATLPPGNGTGWPRSLFWDCWVPPGVVGWAENHGCCKLGNVAVRPRVPGRQRLLWGGLAGGCWAPLTARPRGLRSSSQQRDKTLKSFKQDNCFRALQILIKEVILRRLLDLLIGVG